MNESWPARLVVNERQHGWVGYAVQTTVNDGSKLLIFVAQAAHDLVLLLALETDHVAGSGSVIPVHTRRAPRCTH